MRCILFLACLLVMAGCIDPGAVDGPALEDCPGGFCMDPMDDAAWHSPGRWLHMPDAQVPGDVTRYDTVQDVIVGEGVVAWAGPHNITDIDASGAVTVVPYVLGDDAWRGAELRPVDGTWWSRDRFERVWRTTDGQAVTEGPGEWFQVRQEERWRTLVRWQDGVASPVATSAYPLAVMTAAGMAWTEETGGGGSRVMYRDAAGPRLVLETDFDVTHMVASDDAVAVWGHTCPVDAHCGHSHAVPVHWVRTDGTVVSTGNASAGEVVAWTAVHVDGSHLLTPELVLRDDGWSQALPHPVLELDAERGIAWGIDGDRLWTIAIDDLLHDCCR